jgi:hypothetical protein
MIRVNENYTDPAPSCNTNFNAELKKKCRKQATFLREAIACKRSAQVSSRFTPIIAEGKVLRELARGLAAAWIYATTVPARDRYGFVLSGDRA